MLIFEVFQQSEFHKLHYGSHGYFDFDTFVNKTLASFWSALSSTGFGGIPLSNYLIYQQQTSKFCFTSNSFEVLDHCKGQFKKRILTSKLN